MFFVAGEILSLHWDNVPAAPAAGSAAALADVPPPLQRGGSCQHPQQGKIGSVKLLTSLVFVPEAIFKEGATTN